MVYVVRSRGGQKIKLVKKWVMKSQPSFFANIKYIHYPPSPMLDNSAQPLSMYSSTKTSVFQQIGSSSLKLFFSNIHFFQLFNVAFTSRKKIRQNVWDICKCKQSFVDSS